MCTCWDDGCTRRCCIGRPPIRIRHSTTQCSSGPRSWKSLPKLVFSRTLSAVQGNAHLASGSLADEIERLRSGPGTGDIAIGGAALAAEAAELGLLDEYRARVYPVLVGGGIPFFSQRERRVDLELVETRTFSSNVVYLRYLVAH